MSRRATDVPEGDRRRAEAPPPTGNTRERADARGPKGAHGPVDSHLYAIIIAGGGGTRFWPLSRDRQPKQFLAIGSDETLLQLTWRRGLRTAGAAERVLVVTGERYAELTRQQLPELAPANLLLEPEGRDTAPCIAWSAATLAERDPEAVMVVLPADHLIVDRATFARAVRTAATAARELGALVTFGVPPRYPETGYGYIQSGDLVELAGAVDPVYEVEAFREKPDRQVAEGYVEAGSFYWNSGIFVWRVADVLSALEAHLPAARVAADAMLRAADDGARKSAYGAMPAISIDFGLMERADNVVCVRASFDWSDVGSWAALRDVMPTDDDGNVSRGKVAALDSAGNVVHAPGALVALLGVEDLAVVCAGDVVLVASLKRSQDIKRLRERLAELGLDEHL